MQAEVSPLPVEAIPGLTETGSGLSWEREAEIGRVFPAAASSG